MRHTSKYVRKTELKRLKLYVKTFVETVHKELEAKEKYVQNHEAWHHLFDIPSSRIGSF